MLNVTDVHCIASKLPISITTYRGYRRQIMYSTLIVMKFFNDLDILQPSMVKCPE